MAYSKVILNGTTLMDVTQKTVTAGDMLSGKTALKNDGTDITGSIASKSSSDLTASGATVTAPAGYYSSAATKSVASGSATTPATSITANPTISVNSSTGVITASVSGSKSVTPTVSAGYVSSGTAGTVSVSGSDTESLSTQAATTFHPSTTDQTIAAGKYTTGIQTVKAIVLANLTAGNIKDGVTVKVGDSTDDDCVASVTGTYAGNTPTLITKSITANGTYNASSDSADGYSSVTVNVSGGGGGDYPWFGPNTVKDYTKTITINLSNDTSWDSWTASTTGTSILAAPTTADFSYSFDLAEYAITIVTYSIVNYTLKSTATKVNIPISTGRYDICFVCGMPSTYNQFKNLTAATYYNKPLSDTRMYYYNSNGVKATAQASYGAYNNLSPSITSTSSGNTVTLSFKRSSIYARCSTTYFNTARKDDIDSEDTNVVLTIDVYKTPIANAWTPTVNNGMFALMNAAPEA